MKFRCNSLLFILAALLITVGCAQNSIIEDIHTGANADINTIDWYQIGRQALMDNRLDKALDAYNKSIESNSKTAEAYNGRGVTYVKLGNSNQAIADYSKAIALNPKYAQAYYNRGNAYYRSADYNQAIANYNKAIELNPKIAEAYNSRGVTYDEIGNDYQAIADYSKAIELNPKIAEAYSNRGYAYYRFGRLPSGNRGLQQGH